MFRELVRKKQQLSDEECVEVLKSELRGVLSINGDDGYPYGLPIDHYYDEEDGHIYFHSGNVGYKLEMMRKDDRASYCVYDKGFLKEGDWALNRRSVIVFGRIRFIDDEEKALDICRKLSRKFISDEEYIEYEIEHAKHRLVCFELIPEHMTGKLVNEK